MTPAAVQIGVHDEIGRLRDVLVHRPGQEVVRMTQHDFDRMLFDDILAPEEAGREHDMMVDIMRAVGAEVHALREVLAQALQAAPRDATLALLERSTGLWRGPGLEALARLEAHALAAALVEGLSWDALPEATLAGLQARVEGGGGYALRPLPNLMFLRDPCITVSDRVLVARMATAARAREPDLVAFALAHAPRFRARLSLSDPLPIDGAIEGGDVLVLGPQVLLVGVSARTTPMTLERLAREHLFPDHPELARIYVLVVPPARSVMHLDTVLTQVDRELFLGYPPLVTEDAGRGRMACLHRDRGLVALERATALEVLRDELGAGIDVVPCGGTDPLHQQREQWTDGANAIALAPGRIILYARNTNTIAALAERGFVEVRLHVEEPAPERVARVQAALAHPRTVFTFSGGELSRARGGGRCLTMPLRRDPA